MRPGSRVGACRPDWRTVQGRWAGRWAAQGLWRSWAPGWEPTGRGPALGEALGRAGLQGWRAGLQDPGLRAPPGAGAEGWVRAARRVRRPGLCVWSLRYPRRRARTRLRLGKNDAHLAQVARNKERRAEGPGLRPLRLKWCPSGLALTRRLG